MTMLKKLIFLMLCSVVFIGCGDSEDESPDVAMNETLDPASGDVAAGQALFNTGSANCMFCHGPTADGNGFSPIEAPNIRGIAPDRLLTAVRTGPGAMDAFSQSQISTEDLNDIAAWLDSL